MCDITTGGRWAHLADWILWNHEAVLGAEDGDGLPRGAQLELPIQEGHENI